MLQRLALENVAIVDSLNAHFQAGFTVITGETGSGKSILMDAIALAFGARVSPREVLRAGAARGRIELAFDLAETRNRQPVEAFLLHHGVELMPDETELLISRDFTPSASRMRLNGIPVHREVLEELRPWILDIHGQHELTGLFQRAKQRECLDALGGVDLQAIKATVANAYETWRSLQAELARLTEQQRALHQQRDFLQFQWQELSEAELGAVDEDARCQADLSVLTHAEHLLEATGRAVLLLNEGENDAPAVVTLLHKVQKLLTEPASIDAAMAPLLERTTALVEEAKGLASDLSRYQDRVEYQPERIRQLVDRLDALEKLKRKYGPTLADVLATRNRVAEELDADASLEESLETLQRRVLDAEVGLKAACQRLTEARTALAQSLQDALKQEFQSLALPAAVLEIALHPTAYSTEGGEEVEFLFSANPGEPLRPLAKVASGGELSRVLLALKVLTADAVGVKTLLFDEIDTGISGPTAKAVAEKLLRLSRQGLQVFSITHQPIVAAMGEDHLHVQKTLMADSVSVSIVRLADKENRLNVLSRLASGMDAEDAVVAQFAERLLHQAQEWKAEAPVS